MQKAVEKPVEQDAGKQECVQNNRSGSRPSKRVGPHLPLKLSTAIENAVHILSPRPYCPAGAALASSGWVTIETLVIPACFTASISVANTPKGTPSSARR